MSNNCRWNTDSTLIYVDVRQQNHVQKPRSDGVDYVVHTMMVGTCASSRWLPKNYPFIQLGERHRITKERLVFSNISAYC